MQQLFKYLLVCLAVLLLTSQNIKAQYILFNPNQVAFSDLAATFHQIQQYANQVYVVFPNKAPDYEKIQQLAQEYGIVCKRDDDLFRNISQQGNGRNNINVYNQQNSLVHQFNAKQLDEVAMASIHKDLSQTYDYSNSFWEASALDAKTFVSYNELHFFVQYTNSDTTFYISSNYFEIDTTSNMLRQKLTDNTFTPLPTSTNDKSFISIHGCSINKDATFNIVVSYNKNYSKPDMPYARRINIITLNSKKEIIANRNVDNNDTNSKTSTIYNLFGDSVLALTTVFRTTNTYNVKLYKKTKNQFDYAVTLPLKENTLFVKVFPNNFILPAIYRYPYFTTQYDNAIYNSATKNFITLLPEKTYNNFVSQVLMEHTGTRIVNTKNINKQYKIHDLYYNKDNEKLYVVYQENNKHFLNIYDKKNKLLKTINLDKPLGNSKSDAYYYSFNDTFKTLVQTFQINKESRSHTVAINLL